MKTLLSIIIVSYNTEKITKQCLDSIYSSFADTHNLPFEIIVIDNNSQDGSVPMLQQQFTLHKELILVKNKENVGFGKANNQAVRLAKGEYILLLNSDIIVLENAIENLFTFYREHEEKFQFLGPTLRNKDLSLQPSAGSFYSPFVVFGALFLKGDYWGLTRSSPRAIRRVDWVSGACILTKKKYYQDLNGMDEGIFMYMEEVDLLYRARQKNLITGFYPNAEFIHLGSASSGGKTYPILQVYKGFKYFYRKHYSSLDIFLLKIMLQLKALISLLIGFLTNNRYLKETYGKAYQMAVMD
ncbi:glycosyltransferase family 2 protein [Candidatus Roizmanbacteria bacterium]|nr:glycosyltransferase family 2 protein [Candidatus Roizmanbacteria bacterium]